MYNVLQRRTQIDNLPIGSLGICNLSLASSIDIDVHEAQLVCWSCLRLGKGSNARDTQQSGNIKTLYAMDSGNMEHRV